MSEIQYDKSVVVRLLAADTNAVATSTGCHVLGINSHIDIVGICAVETCRLGGSLRDVVDVTRGRIGVSEEVEHAGKIRWRIVILNCICGCRGSSEKNSNSGH